MLKKTIVYTNPFTDETVTEDHYFHVSKADLVEMEMEEHALTYEKNGEKFTGMQAKLQKIVDSQDGKAIISEIKDIIRRSYGRKNGDRFSKSPAIWEEFSSTEAFSQLLFELCTDADAASQFMNGIIPNNLDQIADEIRIQAEKLNKDEEAKETTVAETLEKVEGEKDDPNASRVLTRAEMIEMDGDELRSGLASGRYKLS